MDYQLAKKLKKAGFPQNNEEGGFRIKKDGSILCFCATCQVEIYKEDDFRGSICLPALPELVEEITRFGLEFGEGMPAYRLRIEGGQVEKSSGWTVEFFGSTYGEKIQKGEGETLEIAVANLWLELNK